MTTIPRKLVTAILGSWDRETSSDPNGWSSYNPAWGQCAVTALVVQDFIGGQLVRAMVGDVSHYWNELPHGVSIDLTRQQFPKFEPGVAEWRARSYVLSFPDTRRRYELLRRRVDERL